MKRVAITGLGVISPLGNTVSEFWKNVVEGKSGAGPITKFDASKFKTRFGCEVKGFHPENLFEKKEIKKYDLVFPLRHGGQRSGPCGCRIESRQYAD